jgi:cytochrome P450
VPNGLSYDELLETCRVLVTAGSETTGTLLTGLTYYLLANPSVYEKLVKEIRGAFKEGNEINMQSVQKLDYLLAVINEALRLFPPVPGNLRRMTPQEGWWITGLWVPGNVVVAVDVCALSSL